MLTMKAAAVVILRMDENILRGAGVLRGMLLDDLTLVQCNLNFDQEIGRSVGTILMINCEVGEPICLDDIST